MHRSVIVALVVGFSFSPLISQAARLSAASAAQAQTPAPGMPSEPVVVTSGEGLIKRAPDRAFVQVTVESRARSPREAQKINADAMTAVLQKLRGAGLAGDAIQTRGYDLQPEYDYNNGRQTLKGYLARNTLEVRVDDLPRVGEVLDLAVSSGATSVGNVRFDLKDRDGAEREALRLAVEDARKRADAAAAGAGVRVDRVLRIEEQRLRTPPIPLPMMQRAGSVAEQAEPPIAPGDLEIRVSVTMTAAIK